MGSDSDWPVMQAAARILKEHGVPYEARVVSAHRTPDLLFEYAASARERGLRAIIAGPAAQPICRAWWPPRPPFRCWVCPFRPASSRGWTPALHRPDAQGVPVATFAIGEAGAANAGLFAVSCSPSRKTAMPPLPAAARRFSRQRTRPGAGPHPGGPGMILPPATLGMLGAASSTLRDGRPPPRLQGGGAGSRSRQHRRRCCRSPYCCRL